MVMDATLQRDVGWLTIPRAGAAQSQTEQEGITQSEITVGGESGVVR